MLSKVVPARSAGAVKAAIFPAVARNIYEAAPGPPGENVSAVDNGSARELRDQVRALEAQVATARRDAFEAGRAQGEQQARAELQPVLERLATSVAEITGMRGDLRRRAERDLVQLALLIARRVLHRELSVDENALLALARVIFDRLARSEQYSVRVHPRFADAIRAALPAAQASRVRIEPDAACEPGALVIQSAEGTIDASIDTQLEEIGRGLTDRLVAA